jgi:O-antigen biosynthesis protein
MVFHSPEPSFSQPDLLTFENRLSPTPLVSIVIPVHNKYAYTLACLQSISAHLDHFNQFEIIVVDDASSDETVIDLVKILGIQVIQNAQNLGFIRSCNRGAADAKGQFLCFLNNDTEVLAGWLEQLVTPAIDNPQVGAVGAKLLYPDGTLQEAGGIIWQNASGWNYGRSHNPQEPDYNYPRPVDYCSGACLLVRKTLFETLGGFSEEFLPAYYEDTDLCFQIRGLGYQVIYQPQAQIIHHEGISSGTSLTQGIKKYQQINAKTFQQKWQIDLQNYYPVLDKHVELASRRLRKQPIILFIDSYVPLYDQESGSCRVFHIVRLLRNLGYTVIFFPDDGYATEPYTSEIQAFGVEVAYKTARQPEMMRQLIQKYLPLVDIAWICRPNLCEKYLPLLKLKPGVQIIYDTVDLHFLRLEREQKIIDADDRRSGPTWQEVKTLELGLAQAANVTLTVTDVEKQLLQKLGVDTVQVIPNVHLPYSGTLKSFSERQNLLFIGGYRHPPNVDAVIWLVQEIMPIVWQTEPTINVFLLGNEPPEKVLNLAAADSRIIVPGYLRDVESYFLNTRIFVAPLRYGAGMKGKIGQSLSYSLPTITTSIGAEGIGLAHGVNALIADQAEDLAKYILQLYTNEKLWQHLSQNSLAAIYPYTPDAIQIQIQALIESLTTQPHPKQHEWNLLMSRYLQQEVTFREIVQEFQLKRFLTMPLETGPKAKMRALKTRVKSKVKKILGLI